MRDPAAPCVFRVRCLCVALALHRGMELEEALVTASEEVGLQDYYRDMVRPLLRMPRTQWPSCCGGGCEPCAQTLVAVATRVEALLSGTA